MATHVVVTGKVQGVWFRESMRQEAERHGVTGWVRNLADGTVEATIDGPPDAVAALVAWCHEGPANARVDRVQCEDSADALADPGFQVRR